MSRLRSCRFLQAFAVFALAVVMLLVVTPTASYAETSVVAQGSCGTSANYTIYDNGLMTFTGSGDVSFSGTTSPWKTTGASVKAVIVDEGITSFCNFAFSGLKNTQAIFFKGSYIKGYNVYFKQYALSGLNDDCVFYCAPGDDSWSNYSSWNYRHGQAWVEGMLNIDWATLAEFDACGDQSFWVLKTDGTMIIQGAGDVSEHITPEDESSVTALVVDDGITSLGEKATFTATVYTSYSSGYTNLSKVTISDTVTELPSDLFYGCPALEEVKLPSALTSIPEKMFKDCTSLTTVTIPNSVIEIGSSAFDGCTTLQEITFGSSLQAIGEGAFEDCSALANITLPQSLLSIGKKAFSGTAITDLVVPAAVTTFESSCISNCESIQTVTFEGDLPSFGSFADVAVTAIHYPGDSWNARAKYNFGNAVWYTKQEDGTLVEDDYISPYESETLVAGTIANHTFNGSSATYAFNISLESSQTIELSWWRTLDNDCTHCSFTFTLKSAKGNKGSTLETWISNYKSAWSEAHNLNLEAGNYVVEVTWRDSHNSSIGLIGLEYNRVSPFSDVSAKTDHSEDIYWLKDANITTGFTNSDGTKRYEPYAEVARCDMAAFLYRLAGSPDYTPSEEIKSYFSDVNESTPHYKEVLWLAEAGISKGWAVDSTHEFRSYETIKRCDMAAFLQRLSTYQGKASDVTPAESSKVSDLGSDHTDAILWLVGSGVSAGWDNGDGTCSFRPLTTVKRCDMAAFLHRMRSNGLA